MRHASSEVDSNIVTVDWILWMEGEKEEKIEVENKISSERTEGRDGNIYTTSWLVQHKAAEDDSVLSGCGM